MLVAEVVKAVVEKCIAGQSIREISELADAIIATETGQIFKKEKDLRKGKFVISHERNFFVFF